MNGLSLTNTRDIKANSIYLNYDNDIKNILEIFSLKNDSSNITNTTYTKTEVDTALLLKSDKLATYTKS